MNWRGMAKVIGFALILIAALAFIVQYASAVTPYYVQQGDTVYLNETVDISGVAAGVLNLAYYNGYDCVGDNQYLIPLPKTKSGYYNFYIDSTIFGSRMGRWCKWNGYEESNGNIIAFVLSYAKPIPFNSTSNITLQNPNQTPAEFPKVPIMPVKHISDYLIARGNGFSIPVNGTTNCWIFGARDSLLDYHSFNGSIDITPEAINTLSPGSYTVLLQTRENGTGETTVRYNPDAGMIQWFDPKTFTIHGFSVTQNTPETVLNKLIEILPEVHDKYQLFKLEVQDPTIVIDLINSLNYLNDTGAPQTQGIILGQQSYMDVRGYTNAAPDTLINVVVDADFNGADPWKDAIATKAEGDLGGDMRAFKVLVPLKLYDMAPGRHFVSARSALAEGVISTADFYIYDNPTGNVIPNKTIRYVSGRYGPEELVPTPTPIVVTQVVTRVVTQVVTVPVTPSNEQVYAQQKKASEATYWEAAKFWSMVVVGGFLIGGGSWYGVSIIRRLKKK